jgi:hypothetical protein
LGLNEKGCKRRLPVAAFGFLSGSSLSNWRDIFGQLFLGSLMFSLLGLAGFYAVRGLDKVLVGTNGRAGSPTLP